MYHSASCSFPINTVFLIISYISSFFSKAAHSPNYPIRLFSLKDQLQDGTLPLHSPCFRMPPNNSTWALLVLRILLSITWKNRKYKKLWHIMELQKSYKV